MVDAIPTDNVIDKGHGKAVVEKLKLRISRFAAERKWPVWVDSCLSWDALDFPPDNLLCLSEGPGSARSGH